MCLSNRVVVVPMTYRHNDQQGILREECRPCRNGYLDQSELSCQLPSLVQRLGKRWWHLLPGGRGSPRLSSTHETRHVRLAVKGQDRDAFGGNFRLIVEMFGRKPSFGGDGGTLGIFGDPKCGGWQRSTFLRI
jgi:hypothetical protein